MHVFVKSLLALSVLMTLGACAGMRRECPPGTHEGPYGHRCLDNGR